MSGVRSVKIANGERHEYVTQNGSVVRDYVTNANTGAFVRCLDFFYDQSGRPLAMRKYYNSTLSGYDTFHYVLNAQGDVVQLNYQGKQNKVYARYTYDAYGNVLTKSGSLADLNPLLYRGYYCDTETGFYYLQSRYYDPIVKRFLNADSYASTGQGFLGHNMFAYCNNSSINTTDPTGNVCCSILDEPGMLGGGKKYDREAAVEYAKAWHDDRNEMYYSYGQDCTNFTSQCLNAGGIEMSEEWHSYRGSIKWYVRFVFSNNQLYHWDVAEAWRLAKKQYEFFSNPANGYIEGEVIQISSSKDVAAVANSGSVRPGDLMYFSNDRKGIHHSTIITKVEGGMIYYSAHTDSCFDNPLNTDETLYIIRIGY